MVEKKVSQGNKAEEDEGPKKKKRFLGSNLLDDSDEECIPGVMGEIKRYKKEKKLSSDGDPFLWWRNHRVEYPVMARLARKYLAVQVIIVL